MSFLLVTYGEIRSNGEGLVSVVISGTGGVYGDLAITANAKTQKQQG